MIPLKHVALVLLTLVIESGVARADNYGAIALSPSTGASGWAYDHPNRASAENSAVGSCARYARDCGVAVWFYNNCGAAARNEAGAWYGSYGSTRAAAEASAIAGCRKYGGKCEVAAWACNGTGGSDFNGCSAQVRINCAAQCGGYQEPCYGGCVGGNLWRCN